MAIGRTDEWRQSSLGQRHADAKELFGCHSRNPSGLAVIRPRKKAGHVTAFVLPPNSCNVALESRAVPPQQFSVKNSGPRGSILSGTQQLSLRIRTRCRLSVPLRRFSPLREHPRSRPQKIRVSQEMRDRISEISSSPGCLPSRVRSVCCLPL